MITSPQPEIFWGGGTLNRKNPGGLESFTKNQRQKNVIIGSIIGIILVIGGITLYKTYAFYKEEKEFNVLQGKIPNFNYDIKMLSIVVDEKEENTIPNRGLYKANIECSKGTRGEWDYNAWNLVLENVNRNSTCNVTFTSNLTQEEYNQYIEAGKALRRNTYRGKDISSYHEDGSLYTMIEKGTFDDIYVGDYIVANNITWLVADIDNYLYTGYKEGAANNGSLTRHHLTIIPADNLTYAAMNSTNTTEGGYYNSQMKQSTLPSVLSTYVEPAFQDHVLTYASFLTNAIDKNRISSSMGTANSGASSSWAWYESQIDLMSEINVYGANIFSSSGLETGIDNRQYALFQIKPEFINTNGKGVVLSFWLKNVSYSVSFAYASGVGQSSSNGASSSSIGVRPRFLIG